MSLTLGELAVRFGCELRGDPDLAVRAVAPLDGGPGTVGFVASRAYAEALAGSTNTAVVVEPRLASRCPVAALVSPNPHATFARIATLLHPEPAAAPGIAATAVVAPGADVDPAASVGHHCVVEDGARIGSGAVLGPHCVVGRGAVVGAHSRLHARVTLGHGVSLGERCIVHPGAVIGSDGFGNAKEGEGWVKVPQLGSVRVGPDVEIGANTTIDRGALGDTVVEEGVKLDNQIQVAHNVVIGAHTAIAACTGIAGSTRIGRRCMIGGGTGITGQITIADDVIITGFGMVTRSIAKAGYYSSVIPVEDVRTWRRIVGRLKRLDSLAARVAALEGRPEGEPAQPEEDDD